MCARALGVPRALPRARVLWLLLGAREVLPGPGATRLTFRSFAARVRARLGTPSCGRVVVVAWMSPSEARSDVARCPPLLTSSPTLPLWPAQRRTPPATASPRDQLGSASRPVHRPRFSTAGAACGGPLSLSRASLVLAPTALAPHRSRSAVRGGRSRANGDGLSAVWGRRTPSPRSRCGRHAEALQGRPGARASGRRPGRHAPRRRSRRPGGLVTPPGTHKYSALVHSASAP